MPPVWRTWSNEEAVESGVFSLKCCGARSTPELSTPTPPVWPKIASPEIKLFNDAIEPNQAKQFMVDEFCSNLKQTGSGVVGFPHLQAPALLRSGSS